MTSIIIEINDAALSISEGGELLLESPGYAVLDGDQLYLGNEALKLARIRPRWTNNRFWAELGNEPLSGATPQLRHHADLAYAHLASVWKQAGEPDCEVVFAVPGSWTTEQLGLLLGLAEELGMKVRCLVDAALAACAGSAEHNLSHLDISLHRVVLSELSGGDTLARRRLLVLAEEGLVHFNNLWADTIADQFVHATRFDPMHSAATEQQIHDQLPACLLELNAHATAVVAVDDAGKQYSVTVRRDQLVSAAAAAYPRIVRQLQQSAGGGPILLSERFSGFPGLEDALAVVPGISIEKLTPGSAARGCVAALEMIDPPSDEVRYYTELPRSKQSSAAVPTAEPAPTHLLFRGQAWVLGASPTLLGVNGGAVHA
ncbi:MAG: hypothetical protein KJP03_06700, partial [Gammaproteobacteria bacterium]|nr:hypothetical protein [Gammaproteobacteria bacterium]